MNQSIVFEPTDVQLAAIYDEMSRRNAKRPGNTIPTARDLVIDLVNDLVRVNGPSVQLLADIMRWWSTATAAERAERMAKAGFEVTVIAGA